MPSTSHGFKPSARELGKRLRVTNQMRQLWRLWTIAPYDVTDEELAKQRKAKDRERKRRSRERQRQRQGRQTREQWLAGHSISRDKPWLSLGIKQRAYYKRLKKYGSADGALVASAMKLKQHRTQPVHQSKRHLSRAIHAASRPKLNTNRKSRGNRTAESVAADATNRPHVLRTPPVHSTVPAIGHNPRVQRTQPVSPINGTAGIGHNAGPPLKSPVDLPEMVDDLLIPAFLGLQEAAGND